MSRKQMTMILRGKDSENLTYLTRGGENLTEVTQRALAFLVIYERDREQGVDWLRRHPHRDELDIITVL